MNDCLVIIPTYNEKENIEDIIQAVFDLSQPFDVLVVDDNSPDGTGEIVRDLKKNSPPVSQTLHLIVRNKKAGLGTAYIAGFKYALENGYKYMCEMDADFSHNPKDLIKLLNACKNENYDVAVGSRYITGVNVVNWPLNEGGHSPARARADHDHVMRGFRQWALVLPASITDEGNTRGWMIR